MDIVIGALFSLLCAFVVMKKIENVDSSNSFLIFGMRVLSVILSGYAIFLLYMFYTGSIH